jgi:hypothetical protein
MKLTKNEAFLVRVVHLHALIGSDNPNERESAWRKLDGLLTAHGKSWNDLAELLKLGSVILAKQGKNVEQQEEDEGDDDAVDHTAPIPDVFELVYYTLKRYLYLTGNELVALTLWVLHTYVFDRFMITPRLFPTSAVRGCGKTTLLNLLNWLACYPERHDDPSVAALYQTIDSKRPTLLIDEADNLRLSKPGPMRTLFNVGHHETGSVTRSYGGEPRRFSVFCPLAIAAIGSLPLPLQQRAVILRMQRAPASAGLRRFDTKNTDQRQDCDNIRGFIFHWKRQCKLDTDPPMPKGLHNRRADNWRVLLAIADDLDRGELARDAAVALSRQHQDEDIVVELLADIRQIFDASGTDRLFSTDLCAELHGFEDRPWGEWRGLHDNLAPRPLSQSQLSNLLRPFGIAPRPLWPAGPRAGLKSRRGYLRHQFEAGWASYVDLEERDEEDTSRASRPLLRLL